MNPDDPWGNNVNAGRGVCGFDDNFGKDEESKERKKPVQTVINDNYSSTLEYKLQRVQKKKNNGSSRNPAKDMLTSMQTQRESFMANLIDKNDSTYNTVMSTGENPSFIDNLYQTNSIYRHLNPQQALESSEKIPIVYHDELNNVNGQEKTQINGEMKKQITEYKEET
ncbi:uncharacterized protein [Clytia hemisphaerica]